MANIEIKIFIFCINYQLHLRKAVKSFKPFYTKYFVKKKVKTRVDKWKYNVTEECLNSDFINSHYKVLYHIGFY